MFPLLCPQSEVDVLPMFSRESHHSVCLFAGVLSILAKAKDQAGTGWLSLHIPAPLPPDRLETGAEPPPHGKFSAGEQSFASPQAPGTPPIG